MKKTARTIAAILAAVMTMTTAASIAASADSSNIQANYITADKGVDLGVETLLEGIKEFFPGGKTFAPVLRMLTNDLLGKGKELTLADINARINDMFKKVEALNDQLRDSMQNITAIQSFDSFQFKTFNSQIQEIISQIEVIRKLDISEENKYAQIGALINGSSCWAESNNVFVTFNSLTQALNRPSLTKNCDIFTLLYEHYAQSSMFSGEALDKARAAADLIITDYIAGCYALIQCLSAQSKVCNMTPEQKSTIEPEYLARITKTQKLINTKIEQIKDALYGNSAVRTEERIKEFKAVKMDISEIKTIAEYRNYCDGETLVPVMEEYYSVTYDENSVVGRYDAFRNMNRMIFINKGTDKKELRADLTVTNHNAVPVYPTCTDSAGRMGPVYKSTRFFNENIKTKMGLDSESIKAIAAFISGKGITMRQYLKNNGFKADAIPAGANILTGEAYNDAAAAKNFFTGIGGSLVLHTFYKGINIDEIDPAEKEITLYSTGAHVFGYSEWNFVEGGNVVTFNSANPSVIKDIHTQNNGFWFDVYRDAPETTTTRH